MLITRAGPHNYQPAADGPPSRHEKLGKWICNGVADLIYVRENKVRKSEELPENGWKPTAQDRPLTELKNVSVSEVFGNYGPLDSSIVNLSQEERWGGGYWIGKSGSAMVTCSSVTERLIRFCCWSVWPAQSTPNQRQKRETNNW